MTHHKNHENESQDARRRDDHNETHPDEKMIKHQDKPKQDPSKHPITTPTKKR